MFYVQFWVFSLFWKFNNMQYGKYLPFISHFKIVCRQITCNLSKRLRRIVKHFFGYLGINLVIYYLSFPGKILFNYPKSITLQRSSLTITFPGSFYSLLVIIFEIWNQKWLDTEHMLLCGNESICVGYIFLMKLAMTWEQD